MRKWISKVGASIRQLIAGLDPRQLWQRKKIVADADAYVDREVASFEHDGGDVTPRQRKEATDDYSFYFRGQILDRLDDYFKIIARMKRTDRNAFELYSKVGAHVLPAYRWNHDYSELPAWWRQTRPAFGAVAWGVGKDFEQQQRDDKMLVPRFVYFVKFKRTKAPPHVQRALAGCDVYVCTVYWHGDRHRLSFPTDFPVAIDADGNITILKTLIRGQETVRAKRGAERGYTFKIPTKKWDIPEFFYEWAREHKRDPSSWLREIFINAVADFEASNTALVRVNVTNNKGLVAVFGINARRSAYFFKDRDVTLNAEGGKRKIFHIVRAHERKRGNKIGAVRIHFRGERDFRWNGHHLNITVPGLHHTLPGEFTAPMIDHDESEYDRSRMVGMSEMGEIWRKHIAGKPLSDAFEEDKQQRRTLAK